MRNVIAVWLLIETAAGFTISVAGGAKKLAKTGFWRSPDYGLDYQLLTMSSSATPVELRSEELSGGVKVIKDVGSGDVLDLHHPRSGPTKLILHGRNDGDRQKFVVEGDEASGYRIKNGSKCLEYDEEGNVYGAACSAEKTQQKFSVAYVPEDPEYKPPATPAEAGGAGAATDTGSGAQNPRRPTQIFIFNERNRQKDHSHDHHSHDHHNHHTHNYYTHNHHTHNYSQDLDPLHEVPYLTYERYPAQAIA